MKELGNHRPATDKQVSAQALSALDAYVDVAIQMLLHASQCAAELKRNHWDFAVEIQALHKAGVNDTCLRVMLCRDLVEHADEITLPGDNRRRFRPLGQLRLTDSTCFVLTQYGMQVAKTGALETGQNSPPDDQPVNNGPLDSSSANLGTLKPVWNSERHELWFNGALVKQFKHRSPNQEAVLMAFQEDGWPASVADPLSPVEETDPKRRLNDTIKSLNHYQKNQLIRFRGDGTGEAVLWERITEASHDVNGG